MARVYGVVLCRSSSNAALGCLWRKSAVIKDGVPLLLGKAQIIRQQRPRSQDSALYRTAYLLQYPNVYIIEIYNGSQDYWMLLNLPLRWRNLVPIPLDYDIGVATCSSRTA